MKRFFFTFFVSLLLLSWGQVQGQMSRPEAEKKAQTLLNAYQADLELTVEQVMDFHSTLSSYLVKKSELDTKSMAADAKRTALKALSDEETAKMSTILSPEQLKKYRQLKPGIQPL